VRALFAIARTRALFHGPSRPARASEIAGGALREG
jgi:hypothetical protein